MPRRDLSPRISWDDTYAYLAYVDDALHLAGEDGDANVAILAKPVDKLLVEWEVIDGERRARRRAVSRANALVRRRDLQADVLVTVVHNDVLATVKLDREAPLFKRLFPNPLSSVVRLSLESEMPDLRALSLKLGEPETPAALKKAHEGALLAIIEQGQMAVTGREHAFAEAGRVSARVVSFRQDANATLLGVEGKLKALAAERRLVDFLEQDIASFLDAESMPPRPVAECCGSPRPAATRHRSRTSSARRLGHAQPRAGEAP